jgi:DNA-binding CsgD family transcriptional regulator
MELSRGDPGAAHEHLDPLVHTLLGGGDPVAMRAVIPIDVEALVGLGRLDEAQALLGPYERIARSRHHGPAMADSLRARGLLLAAKGDVDGASKMMDEAHRLYVQMDNPWELARHQLLSGEVHRRARRRAKAAEAFSMASDGFDRLGARLWAERARSELDRNAGRRHAAHGLTPTQFQIAELVTAGRTNREVAGALFMSRHTVEAHLTSIYRSFGIRSRGELGRVLRDSPTASRDSTSRNGPET